MTSALLHLQSSTNAIILVRLTMKNLIVAFAVLVAILYSLLSPDRFADAVNTLSLHEQYVRSLLKDYVLHMGFGGNLAPTSDLEG